MVRTQIQLSEGQLNALRELSGKTGKSVAELTREGVNLLLQQQRHASRDVMIERATSIAGRFASGIADISAEHDQYIAEASPESLRNA